MFLKAYDLLLSLGKKLDLIMGGHNAVPAFAYRMSLKSNFLRFFDLLIVLQHKLEILIQNPDIF